MNEYKKKTKEFRKNIKPDTSILIEPKKSFFEKLSVVSDNANSKFRYLLAFLIFVLAFILYSNTIKHDYALDDDLVYKLNKSVQKGFSGIHEIFTTTNMYGFNGQNYGAYRPVTQSFFAVEYQFFGLKPEVNHLISVIWYALSCALFFLLMLLLFKKQKLFLPLLVTVLFVVHPIHTEVVANIKSRDEIIAFFFGFVLTFMFLLKYVDTKKILYLICSVLFYFTGLLSKENIITLFPLIPLTLYFFRDLKWKQIVVISMLFLVPLLLFVGLRANFIESADDKIAFIDNFIHLIPDFITKTGTILVVFLLYIRLSFFPFPLSYDYSYAQLTPTSLFSPISLCGLFLIIVLIISALYFLKRKYIYSWAILFFLITLSIYLHIYAGIAATAADRFLFLPSVAISIVIINIIFLIFSKFRASIISNKYASIVIIVICLVFTIKTFVRNYAWKNNESLFLTDITHSPNSARMNKSAGDIYMNWAIKQTDTEKKNHFAREALTYLHKAQRIYPDYADNLLDLGTAYFYLDEFDSTQYYWNRFKQLEPKSFHNSENKKFLINGLSILGIKLQKQGQIKESEAEFEKVIQLDSMDAPALFNIGMLNATLLNYPKAVEYMEKAVAIDSLNAEYWYNYGGLAFTIKNYGLARSAWLKTLQINPQHSQAKQGLNAIKKYQ